jgi:hypothetical protein
MAEPWGLFVVKKGLQGLNGLPAGRRESLARAAQHGEHDTPVYLPSRVVTIDGVAIEKSVDELHHLLDSLTGIGAAGDSLRVQFTRWDTVRWADGRRISADADDEGRWLGRKVWAPFQIQFVFPDPRLYGEARSFPFSGSAVRVFHYGNFPASPKFTIPSAPSSYSISWPGGFFSVTGATTGGTHVVDMLTGRVTRNGVWMPGVGRGPLLTVPPGQQVQVSMSVPGTGLIIDPFV